MKVERNISTPVINSVLHDKNSTHFVGAKESSCEVCDQQKKNNLIGKFIFSRNLGRPKVDVEFS